MQTERKVRGVKPKGAVRRTSADALTYPSIKSAARAVGMSGPTFAKNVLPLIPHQRVGNRVLISKAVLQAWLENQGQAA